MPDFSSLLDKLGGGRRAMIIIIGIAAAGLIFAVSQWAGAPTWVPAATNVPIETTSQLTDKLDQAGVKYRLERGGADVMVDAADLAKARVALAKGGLPMSGRPGLELFDQPSWGMTDFTQRINYRRALEGELERTINKMAGIENAQVHLVLHETDTFGAADKPTEASVVLKLKGETDPETVKGIAHLVAASVEGLTSEHVTIVNDAGRLLNEGIEQNTITGLTSRQLQMQREMEDYLRTKAERIVAQMVGNSNLRVQVSAPMSFDQVERVSATVDPDRQAVSAEQKAEIVPGAQGGAGQNNTSTTYENTKTTENYVSAPGSIKRLTVAVLVADRAPDPKVKNATATPRAQAELDQINELVRSAVGADSTRGDVVSVVSVPFAPVAVAPVEAPKTDIVRMVQTIQRPLFGVLGLVVIIVVALMSLKQLKAPSGATDPAILALPRTDGNAAAGMTAAAMPLPIPTQPLVMPTNTMRDKIQGAIESQPDTAARVVRAWLKEG
jgi:flagellar M-ring protein FliF